MGLAAERSFLVGVVAGGVHIRLARKYDCIARICYISVCPHPQPRFSRLGHTTWLSAVQSVTPDVSQTLYYLLFVLPALKALSDGAHPDDCTVGILC